MVAVFVAIDVQLSSRGGKWLGAVCLQCCILLTEPLVYVIVKFLYMGSKLR